MAKVQLRRDKVLPREVQEVLESQGLNVQAAELSKFMHSLLPTFEAECQAKLVFIVTEKRIDVHKLLFNVPKLMAPTVFKALPEIAQFDFVQAGRCIAFELPTAAAFHVLRGTEAVLRHFYFSLTHKSDRVVWAQAVTALRQLNDSSLKPALDHLDNIRSNLRNPTLHPDVKEYNIEEAQDLFNLCIDAVNRMAGNSNWKPFP